jgi:hypothetical protein
LHAKTPGAALINSEMHALLALVDDLRLLDNQDKRKALAELIKRIENPVKKTLPGEARKGI